MSDDLSPEQQLVVAMLVLNGADPTCAAEAVRENRVDAYYLGSHVLPVVEQIGQGWAEAIEAFKRITG